MPQYFWATSKVMCLYVMVVYYVVGKVVGALEAQSAVRMNSVVEAPPFFDDDTGFGDAQKDLLVKAFIT